MSMSVGTEDYIKGNDSNQLRSNLESNPFSSDFKSLLDDEMPAPGGLSSEQFLTDELMLSDDLSGNPVSISSSVLEPSLSVLTDRAIIEGIESFSDVSKINPIWVEPKTELEDVGLIINSNMTDSISKGGKFEKEDISPLSFFINKSLTEIHSSAKVDSIGYTFPIKDSKLILTISSNSGEYQLLPGGEFASPELNVLKGLSTGVFDSLTYRISSGGYQQIIPVELGVVKHGNKTTFTSVDSFISTGKNNSCNPLLLMSYEASSTKNKITSVKHYNIDVANTNMGYQYHSDLYKKFFLKINFNSDGVSVYLRGDRTSIENVESLLKSEGRYLIDNVGVITTVYINGKRFK
ncbi:hypothetical protein K6Y31_20315 [Motilimonas cestriensis]|uniref:Uncharacterized protein n=1 Tax=Motilimonas cestriensis TaxID=2742685 RepID=A0ABS8WFK9_9GAMM|nr:hypothetical protein [Motilimonas cestriensis]MCE2597122.1 hypothetical protein [Motilimonas cestriensis]